MKAEGKDTAYTKKEDRKEGKKRPAQEASHESSR